MPSSKILIIGGIAIAAVVAAAAVFYFGGETEEAQQQDMTPGTIETASPVATVNGEEVTQSEVSSMQQSFALQGQQISEEDAIEYAIDQKLLVQEAESQGFSPSTQEVEEQLEGQLALRGATIDDLKEQLALRGESYEEQLEGFRSQVAVQQYVEETIEVPEVESSEAREFYEENKEQLSTGDQVPSYEETEGQIVSFLESQKQQEAISELLEQLRAKATIVYT